MRPTTFLPALQSLLLLALLPPSLAATATFVIPASPQLPNPNGLPPTTHATLAAKGASQSAPLSTANVFTFHNVTAGSYLVDVHCATQAFAPVRLDVDGDGELRAWETYRGNDWDNTGEALPRGGAGFELRLLGYKSYYAERSSFSVLSVLKSPMILLGLVSMGIFIGMPYLVDNSEFFIPKERPASEEKDRGEEREKNTRSPRDPYLEVCCQMTDLQ